MNIKKINLPDIKENDLVIVSTNDYTSLFHSDGKVAQTDLVITDLEAKLAEIKVPENITGDARKSAFDEYGRVFSEKETEEFAAWRIRDAAEWYKKSHLIDKAISEGYLKEVVDRFGMNDQLRMTILRDHHTPLLIFGKQGDVLNLGIRTHNWKFGEIGCEEVLPNFHSMNPKYIYVSVYQFRGIAVGPGNIKTALESTPNGTVLSSYLTKKRVLPG